MRYLFFLSIAIAILPVQLFAQCCSMGNPASGQTGLHVLQKNQLKVHTFFKHGYNETYFRQNVRLINYGPYSHSSYDYGAVYVGYGLTSRLTLEHEAGYFFDKQLRFHDPEMDALINSGYGLSNGILSLHYSAFSSQSTESELSVAGGVKYPFSRTPLSIDGVEMPIELQPGTGALGFVGRVIYSFPVGGTGMVAFLQHRYETNRPNRFQYRYGDGHHTSLSVSIPLIPFLETNIQLRNEYRVADTTPSAARLASEGSNILYFTPVVSFLVPGNFQLSVFTDIPLYKYYFGEQLSNRYALGFSLSRSFSLQSLPQGDL
jgi:hypothetical protein